VALAQVYQPTHVIAEMTGPASLDEDGRPVGVAQWRLAQASVSGRPGAPIRGSLVLDDVRIDQAAATPGEPLLLASHAEFHIGMTDIKDPVFHFAASIAGATAPAGGEIGKMPLDAEFTGVLHGLKDLRPKPFPVRLKEWQQTGGRFELTSLRIKRGEAIAIAKGDLGLSAGGRLDGVFDITMAGFEQISQVISAVTGIRMQSGMVAGLSMLGKRTEIEGRKAVAVPLRFKDGAVQLGPIPLGRTAPLY
jgi:hypothetical protein